MRPPRIFLKVCLAVAGAGLSAVAAFNLLVDPYRAFPDAGLELFEPFRSRMTEAPAKAEFLAQEAWDLVLAGTSRVQCGLDPLDPALVGLRTYNAGLVGASMEALADVVDRALSGHPPRQLFLEVELFMFSENNHVEPGWHLTRFDDEASDLHYACHCLFSLQATAESWTMFSRWMRGRDPEGYHGFHPRSLSARRDQRVLFGQVLQGLFENPQALKEFEWGDRQWEALRRILRRCRTSGVAVSLFIPPVHALHQEAVYAAGEGPALEWFRRKLTRTVAEEGEPGTSLWDFAGWSAPCSEPVPREPSGRMQWYLDPSHFNARLGSRVLRMLASGVPEADWGVLLHPNNLEAHLERRTRERERYRRERAEDLVLLQTLRPPAP